MNNNKQIVEQELNKLNAFSGKLNKYALHMADILDEQVPLSMRLNIANYSLASYVGHFHTKIALDDGNIPTNFIGFTLAQSGSAKTSSVNKLERALGVGYEMIEEYRKSNLEKKAREVAEMNDDENWEKYLKELKPLSNSLSTEAGIIKLLNHFAEEGIGLPSLFIDEIGTELATSADIVPNIKLLSELFDAGNKKARALADDTQRRAEVKGMGMSAMFIGSEHNILLDESILKKFSSEFVTKLARRCFFNFPVFDYKEKEANSIEDILSSDTEQRNSQLANALEVKDMAYNIAEMLLNNDINNIEISEEADRLYRIYKFHCKYKSEEHTEEAVLLEQLHRHWKVLKLAGVYAVADSRMHITSDDLIEAISFAEMIDGDLNKFMELSKRELYEVLIDLLRTDKRLTIHELKKKEIITGKGSPDSQVSNLVSLGNSKLGKEGMLKFVDGGIELEIFKEVVHGASYKLISGTKEERAWQCKDGYKYKKSSFDKLANLLSNDTSYCAFEYRDGVRSNDNICSGASFVVLDIDDSDITWEEAHDLLGDFNHHIAKTSDNNNPYKFRAVVELDIEVDLDARLWKNFMSKVGEYLGLNLDLLPKSQIYYGFKEREVLSNLEAEPLPASELIKTIEIIPKEVKKLPSNQISKAYDDRFEVFKYAYEANGNTRASHLYRVFKHAYDLGFTKEQIYAIMSDISEYHGTDIEYIYKRSGLRNQIERAFNGKDYI